jgi:thioredoxin reductase (NADPH)
MTCLRHRSFRGPRGQHVAVPDPAHRENAEYRTRDWTEVVELEGESSLRAIRWRNSKTNEEVRRAVRHLFVLVGAIPNTDFLPSAVLTDSNGFICTGAEITLPGREHYWPLERPPHPLETSCPGVFATGDVRATSTKRVASAVGEGSVVVQSVHQLRAARGA